ncbi:MAG: MBL fold metallo-hydrolase [Actinomycetota bacterium]|nr:MBL fold metallo-hydrolase [Actinomycetota bacterium]
MIVERTEHPSWLSNSYLVADTPGGHGVLIDGNGIRAPLVERIEADAITITHVLCTHGDGDHVVDLPELAERFEAPLLSHELAAGELGGEALGDGETVRSGELEIQALHTPGHAPGHLAFLVSGTDCFTGDVLFKGTVGGTGRPGGSYGDLKRSLMERLLQLPPETRVHPGHSGPTTIGAEWESNPFVRVWRGLDREQAERCRVGGQEATLVLWAQDYDGGHKAWVRFQSGEEAIVGGSRVERL